MSEKTGSPKHAASRLESDRRLTKATNAAERIANDLVAEARKPKRPARKRTEPPRSPDKQKRQFAVELGTHHGEALDRVFGKIVPPKSRQNG